MENNNEEEKRKKRGGFLTSALVATIGLLLATSVFFGWKASTKEELVNIKVQENKDQSSKYNKLMAELDKTSDLLESAKTGEAEKDSALIEKRKELEVLKEKLKEYSDLGSVDEFRKIKAELWKLRSEIRDLKAKNALLMADVERLTTDVNQKNSKINTLESEGKLTAAELAQAKEKAKLGSIITARGFMAEGVRMRRGGEKITTNPKSTEKLRLTFTLNENLIASPGLRTIYLRAYAADGQTVYTNGGSTFTYKGTSQIYTERQEVDYRNQELDVFMYAQPFSTPYTKGVYKLEAYMDGNLLGTTTVELK